MYIGSCKNKNGEGPSQDPSRRSSQYNQHSNARAKEDINEIAVLSSQKMNLALVVSGLFVFFFDVRFVLACFCYMTPSFRQNVVVGPVGRSLRTLRDTFPNSNNHYGDANEGTEAWTCLGEIATISSPWVSFYCERLRDSNGQILDYWRVQKSASCIILVVSADGRLILPKPQYRPGIGRATLDFCGGRCDDAEDPRDAVVKILQRELQIDLEKDVASLMPLNEMGGWVVNSSFSNQLLFGFVANLKEDTQQTKSDALFFDGGDELLHGPRQLT